VMLIAISYINYNLCNNTTHERHQLMTLETYCLYGSYDPWAVGTAARSAKNKKLRKVQCLFDYCDSFLGFKRLPTIRASLTCKCFSR
jgi:hypothetical protein